MRAGLAWDKTINHDVYLLTFSPLGSPFYVLTPEFPYARLDIDALTIFRSP